MDFNSMLKMFIKNGGTPKNLLEQTMLQNPMIVNLVNMAKQGNVQNIETFAVNIYKEQGRDFYKEFAEFRKQFM